MLGAPTRGGWPRLVSSAGGPDPPKVSTTSSAGGPDPLQAVMRWRGGVGANGYFSYARISFENISFGLALFQLLV